MIGIGKIRTREIDVSAVVIKKMPHRMNGTFSKELFKELSIEP